MIMRIFEQLFFKCKDVLKKENFTKNIITNKDKKDSQEPKRIFNYFKEEYNYIMNNNTLDFEKAEEYLTNNACINCGCVLKSIIKGTKTCPECKKKIYIRTNPVSGKKLELGEKTIDEYESYASKVYEMISYERELKNQFMAYPKYVEIFYKCKKEGLSSRDVMWTFRNTLCSLLDDLGYKEYKKLRYLRNSEKTLKSFNIINNFQLAVQELVKMYKIAELNHKVDVSIDLLADIAYRDVQIVYLSGELNDTHQVTREDYINKIHSNLIIECLESNKINMNYFKSNFIQKKHPFVLPRLSNEKTWEYIKLALDRQIEWNKKMNYKK